MTTLCPKCESENIQPAVWLHRIYWCNSCKYYWSQTQQAEIDRLTAIIRGANICYDNNTNTYRCVKHEERIAQLKSDLSLAQTEARNWCTASAANRDATMGFQDRALKAEADLSRLQLNGQPYTCPVCRGQGKVQNGFYSHAGADNYASSSIEPETCRSCSGTGVLRSGPIQLPEGSGDVD